MDLQSAIDAAATDAAKKFVLVAQGSYYADPTKKDRTKSFILKNGVKIYGGFDPNSSSLKRYRDVSILEGKLASYGNTYQLLKGQSLNNTSILDAFLIQNASGSPNGSGSGLYLYDNSSPSLKT